MKQRKAVFHAEKESETLHTHFMIANHVNETTSSRMVTSHQSRNYVEEGGERGNEEATYLRWFVARRSCSLLGYSEKFMTLPS